MHADVGIVDIWWVFPRYGLWNDFPVASSMTGRMGVRQRKCVGEDCDVPKNSDANWMDNIDRIQILYCRTK